MANNSSAQRLQEGSTIRPNDLGDLQLTVMQALWKIGQGSVKDVLAALPSDPAPAYTTVLTVLRNLEKRGFVTHDPVDGSRMYHYRPIISAHDACTQRLRELLTVWYEASAIQLIRHVLLISDLPPVDRDEIRQLLDELDQTD